MEQDVETDYRIVCCTCLSSGRNLQSLNEQTQLYQTFRLLMYDFAGDRFGDSFSEMVQLVCWECLALMKRFLRFKQQVQSAQEHLRVLALSQETVDHTYLSQSLSTLTSVVKSDYDNIFFDYSIGAVEGAEEDWQQQYLVARSADIKNENFDVAQAVSENIVAQVVRDNINLDLNQHMLEVPEMVLENPVTGVMSHIVVNSEALAAAALTDAPPVKTELVPAGSTASPSNSVDKVILYDAAPPARMREADHSAKCPYFTVMMSDEELQAYREECKQKLQYASAYYKCELCIIGFYQQQQVEEHFVSAHKPSEGKSRCPICYSYVAASSLPTHVEQHYARFVCKLCGRGERARRLMELHCETHTKLQCAQPRKRKKKDSDKDKPSVPPKPGDLRKLLSKTTIEGYKCLECDMFFKNSRARQTHVARFHREALQCDHCKKRFVNRTTLVTHLKLHAGPPPREECPVCRKLVRSSQLKYHVQRHQNTTTYSCADCDKVFSHLATYQAHLKYARAHASENVFKYPCPMCNKGYPTKEQMQDHFNYNHLNKTTHKCPICDKPIASRKNVERHMMRVHEKHKKKEKPRNHVCVQCGKTFTDKKSITQHLVIHSGERPLSCDICHQTFKQKASLYTHRKRVHKLFPQKKQVEFMPKPGNVSAS